MSADFTPTMGAWKTTGAFRFWCQKVLPAVYDDSLSYYELLCKVVQALNDVVENLDTTHTDVTNLLTAFEELQDYVNNYFAGLDVEEQINAAVDDKLDAMVEAGTFDELFTNLFAAQFEAINTALDLVNEKIEAAPKMVKGNVLFTDYDANLAIPQSFCYIGNNRIVGYWAMSYYGSDTGYLKCIDIVNRTVIWSYPILGYHGNSICYKEDTNEVYLAGCYSYSDSNTYIPNVIVINLSQPSAVDRVILSPTSAVYSMAYDPEEKEFYVTTNTTRSSGGINLVSVLDETFSTVKRTFTLDGLGALLGNYNNTQGLQLYHDGKLYVMNWQGQPGLQIFDATTGDLLETAPIEKYFNGYRFRGELQSVAYDDDNDRFIILAGVIFPGHREVQVATIAEIGLEKEIYAPVPVGLNETIAGDMPVYSSTLAEVYPGRTTGAPVYSTDDFELLRDAIDWAKLNTRWSTTIRVCPVNDNIQIAPRINGFDGTLIFNNKGGATVGKLAAAQILSSRVNIQDMQITGVIALAIDETNPAVIACRDTQLYITSCTSAIDADTTPASYVIDAARSDVVIYGQIAPAPGIALFHPNTSTVIQYGYGETGGSTNIGGHVSSNIRGMLPVYRGTITPGTQTDLQTLINDFTTVNERLKVIARLSVAATYGSGYVYAEGFVGFSKKLTLCWHCGNNYDIFADVTFTTASKVTMSNFPVDGVDLVPLKGDKYTAHKKREKHVFV